MRTGGVGLSNVCSSNAAMRCGRGAMEPRAWCNATARRMAGRCIGPSMWRNGDGTATLCRVSVAHTAESLGLPYTYPFDICCSALSSPERFPREDRKYCGRARGRRKTAVHAHRKTTCASGMCPEHAHVDRPAPLIFRPPVRPPESRGGPGERHAPPTAKPVPQDLTSFIGLERFEKSS